MSTGEQDLESPNSTDEAIEGATAPVAGTETEIEKPKLDLDVKITDVGPCRKHVKVAIARSDIDRQFQDSLKEMTREAVVPGFRPGHAPRQLVERRFRKQVSGQVKSTLLMSALEQLDEDYKIDPIAPPDLDVEAITLPDDGPMNFEIEVEVRPDFDLPAYKALVVNRPTKVITEADIDAQLNSFLERYAQIVPKLDGSAEVGDYVIADIRFERDGETLNEFKETQFRLQPEMRFQDGRVPKLAEALTGAKAGDTREATAEIGSGSANPALRGQEVRVEFVVKDLKQIRLPEVNRSFLDEIGFDSAEELREALRGVLDRRLETQKRQTMRREIMDKLIAEVPFELPKDLVGRQEKSTIRRLVMEMRQGGLSDVQIRAREAEIRANAHESTLRSLKEFFILAKIADAEEIKVEDDDFEFEIERIAARNDESPRRVRARIEKEGLAEGLATQILEQKTLDRIMEYIKFEEVPLVEEQAVETLDQTAASAEDVAEAEAAAAASSEDEGEPVS
ncbi:MAG: trigger factor [Isosphaeraceae bacterium]|nr:trigger factor [Isosphaeraceae bacterium]